MQYYDDDLPLHDQRIIRLRDAKYPNGDRDWDLSEIDAQGERTGPAFRPWRWECSFEACRFELIDECHVVQETSFDDSVVPRPSRRKRLAIRAHLQPDANGIRYSVLGTDREIKNITLEMSVLEGKAETETCRADAGLQLDRRSVDSLHFYLGLQRSDFERYQRLVVAGALHNLFFKVGRVTGFYSEYDEGVGPAGIKVLSKDAYLHKVDTASKLSDNPIPRMGEIGEFELGIDAGPPISVEPEYARKTVSTLVEQAELTRQRIDFEPSISIQRAILRSQNWLLASILFLVVVQLLK